MTSKKLPEWVLASGLQLHLSGIHFDAIRLRGVRGEAVLHHLATLTDGDPGPVVREIAGARWTYFLLAPGRARTSTGRPARSASARPPATSTWGFQPRTATRIR
ncbi:hypothetical protein [Streptomyces sp. NPDC048445]|uniref:hypothetical protein n=1 Tax=Streptomyces sp. NPDC048445 TaxID=3365553 RepID=UPI0037100F41